MQLAQFELHRRGVARTAATVSTARLRTQPGAANQGARRGTGPRLRTTGPQGSPQPETGAPVSAMATTGRCPPARPRPGGQP